MITVVTAVQYVALAWAALTGVLPVSGGGLVLAFLFTVAWLVAIYWLVAGAWRRSVWGCPFEHEDDAPVHRRCVRHTLLPGTAGPQDTATR